MIGNIKAPARITPTASGTGTRPDDHHRDEPDDDHPPEGGGRDARGFGDTDDPVMLGGIRLDKLDSEERDALVRLVQEFDRLKREVEWGRDRLRKAEKLVDTHPTLPTLNRRGFAQRFGSITGNLDNLSGGAALVLVRILNGAELRMSLGIRAHDTALTSAATRLRDSLHATDFVAALGGDDFAVMLLAGDEAGVERQRRRLLEELNQSTFAWNGQTIALSAAAGATVLRSGDSAESAMERADRALRADLDDA